MGFLQKFSILTLVAFLVSCSSDRPNDTEKWKAELDLTSKELLEVKKHLEEVEGERDVLQDKMDYWERFMFQMLSGEDVPVKLVSTTVEGDPHFVFFAEQVPKYDSNMGKIYLIRVVNQILRDYENSPDIISIWDDEEAAVQFAKGEDDKTAFLHWSHRMGIVSRENQQVIIRYATGRDDVDIISYGMSK